MTAPQPATPGSDSDKWGVKHLPDGGMTVTFYDPQMQPLTTVTFDREAVDEFRCAICEPEQHRQDSRTDSPRAEGPR